MSRKTRRLAISEATTVSVTSDVPKTLSASRARTSGGIAMKRSTSRLISWSIKPPKVTAARPSVPPMAKAISVIASDSTIDVRAP